MLSALSRFHHLLLLSSERPPLELHALLGDLNCRIVLLVGIGELSLFIICIPCISVLSKVIEIKIKCPLDQ